MRHLVAATLGVAKPRTKLRHAERGGYFALAFLVVASSSSHAQAPIPIANVVRSTPVSFEKDILPILRQSCLACHGAGDASGELVLESPQSILQGGDSGPAVVPGKSGESLLLNVAAHQEEPFMPPPENDVEAPALSSQDLGLIKLWIDAGAKGSEGGGVLSPEKWRPLPLGPNPIYSVAITPDGQFTAFSRGDQIFIYHTPTGQLITRLSDPALTAVSQDKRSGRAHLDVVQSLAFNQEGDLLASGGFRTLKLWRFPRDVQRLQTPGAAAVAAVAVSPDQSLVALAAANAIQLITAADGKPKFALNGHADAVTAVQFSHDGEKLYSVAKDRTVRAWSVAEGKLVGRIDSPQEITSLATYYREEPRTENAEGEQAEGRLRIEQLATGGGDNFIHLWNVPSELPQTLPGAAPDPAAMAASADRQWLAVAGASGVVQLFDLPGRKLVRQWKTQEGSVLAIAVFAAPAPQDGEAPSKQLIATAGKDGVVRLWSTDTERPIAAWTAGLAPLRSVAFSPDGQRLVTGAEDGSATVWSSDAPEPRVLEAADGGAALLSVVSRDGKKLAVAGQANGRAAILVRDLESGNVVRTLLGHDAPITSLAFSSDGAKLISGSDDKTARVWDLVDEKFAEMARFAGHAGPVRGVALNSDATQALSGADDNSLKLWSVAASEELKTFAGHTGPVTAVAFTPQNQPVSASVDKTIRVWNPANGVPARTINAQAAVVEAAFSFDGTRVATAGDDKLIRILQFDNGAPLHTLAGHAEAPHSLSFSLDNARLVTGSQERALVWNVADGRMLQAFSIAEGVATAAYGPTPEAIVLADARGSLVVQSLRFSLALSGMKQAVTDLVYHPAGQFIYASSADGTVRGYSLANGQQAFAANHGAPVHALALSADNQRLASAGDDKTIKLWNPDNGGQVQPTQLGGFASPVKSVCFTADNARVMGGSATGEVLAFSTADGVPEESLAGHATPVTALFDGSTIDEVISSAEVVRLGKLAAVRRLAGHSQPVTALAGFEDRPLEIVSGSADGTVRRWNIQNAQPIQQFNHGAAITSVAVRPDGKRIASGGANNVAVLWNTENNQQVAQLKGDPRLQAVLARTTQDKTDAVAKVAATKTVLAAAEQDLPVKTQAEQQAATALAAAEADVAAKSTALATVTTTKTNAEKTAIEMAAAAQKAAAAMEAANQKSLELAAKAKLLADDAAKAKSLADANPMSADYIKAYETAAMIAATADAEAKAAEAAKAAPTQTATQAAQAAAQAAQAAAQTLPPFTQASESLTASQMVLRTAVQTQAAAKRELEFATKAIPAAKEEVAQAETALAKIDAALVAAQEAAAKSEQPIRSVAFSPDGSVLAGGGDFGAVHTWDAETGRAITSYHGHAAAVQSLAYRSKNELISGSADKSAIAWTLNPDWRLERTIGDVRDPSILVDRVLGLDFSPGGDLVAAAGGVPSRTGEVKVFRTANGEPVVSIPEAHTDAVNGIAFSPNGEFLATAGSDKYVKKFSLKTGEQLLQFEGHTNHVLDVAWRAGGKILASAGADSTINLWDAETGDRPITIQGYQKQITSVRFQGQTQFLLVSSGDRLIRMHNADNGGVQRDFPGSAEYMYCVDVSADGALVVAGGHDGVLRVWNGANSQSLFTIAH